MVIFQCLPVFFASLYLPSPYFVHLHEELADVLPPVLIYPGFGCFNNT